MIIVKKSKHADVNLLKDNLRVEDINEIWNSNHSTPSTALNKGLQISRACFTAWKDDKPIAMFGVVPQNINPKIGVVWLLGSDDMLKHKKQVIKVGRIFVESLLREFVTLMNYVSSDNKKAIKFLKMLGAEFWDPRPYGIEKKMFSLFMIKAGNKIPIIRVVKAKKEAN
jgi:hypothetical protein